MSSQPPFQFKVESLLGIELILYMCFDISAELISRFAPNHWETLLESNIVSHWLGTNLESTMFQDAVSTHSWDSPDLCMNKLDKCMKIWTATQELYLVDVLVYVQTLNSLSRFCYEGINIF